MSRTLTFDQALCLGCRSCELACAVAHSQTGRLDKAILESVPPKRRVSISATDAGIEAQRCDQCAEPLCVFACKSGALHRDADTGTVHLDESRCLGCYMCLMVCPFGINVDAGRDRMVRCDVCEDREMPACVAACPTHALGTAEQRAPAARSDFRGHVVVVGSSAAGIAACEAAREFAPGCSITLVTADARPQYSRPLLAYLLSQSIDPHALDWRPLEYLTERLSVRVIAGVRASAVAIDARHVELDDGTRLHYDRLIIATGARAVRVETPGHALEGVFTLRDLEDAERIEALLQPGRAAVVLGGGNVGLQTCEALLARGMSVTVVVGSRHLLSQMVDSEAGRRVGELFARHGLAVRTGSGIIEICGSDRVEQIRLNDGEVIPADLVVVGKGIRPNVEWLHGTGVEIGRGVAVDLSGRTNVAGVFAAGDCAEVEDPLTGKAAVSGIWPVAYEMGRAAGSTAVGVERASRGALRMNASRFFDVPIVSIGEVREERLAGGRARVLTNSRDIYRKVVHREGRIAGALFFGDVSGAGLLYRLYRERIDVGEEILDRLDESRLARSLGPLIHLQEIATCPES